MKRKLLAYLHMCLGNQQRVSSQVKEILVKPDCFLFKHLTPDSGDAPLQRCLRPLYLSLLLLQDRCDCPESGMINLPVRCFGKVGRTTTAAGTIYSGSLPLRNW